MGKLSMYEKLKLKLGGICFKIFLWSQDITAERYWDEIYTQEAIYRKNKEVEQGLNILKEFINNKH